MEMLIIVIGFLSSFFLGAYVREPFLFKTKEEKEVAEIKMQEEKKEQYFKEWENLLNYTGDTQEVD